MCSLTCSLTAIDFKVSLVGASGVCQLTADYTDPSSPPQNHMGSGTVYTQSELSVLDLHVCVCVFVKNNKTLDGES